MNCRLNVGGSEASAFEERFFADAGKVWNNGTFGMNPQKFEIKTILRKEGPFIEKVLESSALVGDASCARQASSSAAAAAASCV